MIMLRVFRKLRRVLIYRGSIKIYFFILETYPMQSDVFKFLIDIFVNNLVCCIMNRFGAVGIHFKGFFRNR